MLILYAHGVLHKKPLLNDVRVYLYNVGLPNPNITGVSQGTWTQCCAHNPKGLGSYMGLCSILNTTSPYRTGIMAH